MNSWERIKRMYEHKEADRVPIIDDPWAGTIRRWQNEGMPKDVLWEDYFDVDKIGVFQVDITPRYEEKILEENDRWYISTSKWGVTAKHFKELDSTPEYLDFSVVDEEAWADAKVEALQEASPTLHRSGHHQPLGTPFGERHRCLCDHRPAAHLVGRQRAPAPSVARHRHRQACPPLSGNDHCRVRHPL